MKRAKEDPHVVTIGFQGSTGEEAHADTGMTNAHLASIHEFGAVVQQGTREITIPERSFIRSTVDKNNNYKEVIHKLGLAIITGKLTSIPDALKVLGEKITSDIKRSIEQGIPPPNAPSTIKPKGSSKPLIDSGQMKNAVTYDVHPDDGRQGITGKK